MYLTTLVTFTTAFLATALNAYVITPPTTPKQFAKRDPTAQLTAMLANPNACPTSTGECVTPADALAPILNGLYKYGVTTAPEQAAVISWMAFESVDFKFNHNVSPGRPGQGTRAMLMPNFVKSYVDGLPELASGAAAAGSDVAKILTLVQDNAHSFAAGSWFYNTQCTEAIKSQVKTGSQSGWAAFIQQCVGTDSTDAGRIAYWKRACQQLGVATS